MSRVASCFSSGRRARRQTSARTASATRIMSCTKQPPSTGGSIITVGGMKTNTVGAKVAIGMITTTITTATTTSVIASKNPEHPKRNEARLSWVALFLFGLEIPSRIAGSAQATTF